MQMIILMFKNMEAIKNESMENKLNILIFGCF